MYIYTLVYTGGGEGGRERERGRGRERESCYACQNTHENMRVLMWQQRECQRKYDTKKAGRICHNVAKRICHSNNATYFIPELICHSSTIILEDATINTQQEICQRTHARIRQSTYAWICQSEYVRHMVVKENAAMNHELSMQQLS